ELTHLSTIKHGVTRFRITLDCYLGTNVAGKLVQGEGALLQWMPTEALAELPLSTTGRKMAKLLQGLTPGGANGALGRSGKKRGKKKDAPPTSSREGGGGTRSKAKR